MFGVCEFMFLFITPKDVLVGVTTGRGEEPREEEPSEVSE
jgi:hypothetical protein